MRATILGGSTVNADFYTRGSTRYFHFNFFEAGEGTGNFNFKIDPTKFNLVLEANPWSMFQYRSCNPPLWCDSRKARTSRSLGPPKGIGAGLRPATIEGGGWTWSTTKVPSVESGPDEQSLRFWNAHRKASMLSSLPSTATITHRRSADMVQRLWFPRVDDDLPVWFPTSRWLSLRREREGSAAERDGPWARQKPFTDTTPGHYATRNWASAQKVHWAYPSHKPIL